MRRPIFTAALLAIPGLLFAQEAARPPSFEIADVHASPKGQNQFPRPGGGRGGRYENKNASIVDLINSAYGMQRDKIVGGPNWIEMDRFDVVAKIPPETPVDDQKLMLQSLLAERFGLKVHNETRPLPTFALVAGKKPQLKEADGTGESGCKPQAGPSVPGPNVSMISFSTNGEAPISIRLGPGQTVTYSCRNVTMESFAGSIRGFFGANLGNNPIADETGIKGKWNFDLTFSMNFAMGGPGDQGDRIAITDAVEKQLGLKLETRQIPTAVIVVDIVNHMPTPNPPGIAEALPPIVLPTEFEVVSIKPSEPIGPGRMMRTQMQPGGRFISDGFPLRFLIDRAFNSNSREGIQNVPDFAQSERYDITAKANLPPAYANSNDPEIVAPLIRALLVDRFKMTYHTENREVTAYQLAAGKPKMKKADPASRTHCVNGNGPPGSPPGTRQITCQNITMAQFAEQLRNASPDINWPVSDATGIEGGWDFTLSFSFSMMMANFAGGRGVEGGPAPAPQAADPTGGYTVFEAIERQLGLKLEKVKRTEPVIVIDHLEQKPTEN